MKRYFKIVSFLLLLCLAAPGQEKTLAIAEHMPEFPGGTDELAQFIAKNVQIPTIVREAGGSAKAYVNFVVDTSGKITETKIVKLSGFKEMDKEALRILSIMPNWSPGVDSSVKVRVSMNLPIGIKTIGKSLSEISASKLPPEEQKKHDNAMAQWNEGHKLEREFMFDKALEKFNKSLSIEANNKYALFDKGKMLMALGEKDKACEVWNKMIRDSIRKAEAQEFVKKYCETENGVEAMAKYYSNIKAAEFFSLGMNDVTTGRYEAALRKFDSCLKYKPEYNDALFNKALMHFKLNQKNAACASWTKLLALNPADKQTEDAIKKNCN